VPATNNSQTTTPTPIKKKEPTLPNDIIELEKEVELCASLAVKEYNKANEILKKYKFTEIC